MGRILKLNLIPWAGTPSLHHLQKDKRDNLQLENLFVFFQTQNNPIISESAQSRELCHCWHQAHAAISAATPHVTSASLLLTKGWGHAVTLLGDISSREWLKDTPVLSRTELCPEFLQDFPSQAPTLINEQLPHHWGCSQLLNSSSHITKNLIF